MTSWGSEATNEKNLVDPEGDVRNNPKDSPNTGDYLS